MKEKPTCSLVSELKQREGVKQIWVAPYEPYAIHVNGEVIEDSGPAIQSSPECWCKFPFPVEGS